MATEGQGANCFELRGQGVTIKYETSGYTGGHPRYQPRISGEYKGQKIELEGKQIRQVETEIGQMVTVDLGFEPDRATKTLTLLIPLVNVKGGSPAPFQTDAIITEHLTSIAGPDLVKGAIQKYRFESLEGTASTVLY